MMRNGILLAENSPEKIIRMSNCNDLNEAFLQFCVRQGRVNEEQFEVDSTRQYYLQSHELQPLSDSEAFHNREMMPHNEIRKKKMFHPKTMKALINKSLIQVIRTPM